MTDTGFVRRAIVASSGLTLFILMAAAGADLIEVDLIEEGDGLLTWDTQTNLQWLDVTESDQGVEYVGEQLRLGDEGEFAGFRWATAQEFLSLIVMNSKWTEDQNAEFLDHPEVYASLAKLFRFLGFTSDPSEPGFFAIANTCDAPPEQLNGCRLITDYGTELIAGPDASFIGNDHWLSLGSRPSHEYFIFHANFMTASNYQLLVRSVPEPGIIGLLLGGLLLMGAFGRKRRVSYVSDNTHGA
jgi:hypothetical protein